MRLAVTLNRPELQRRREAIRAFAVAKRKQLTAAAGQAAGGAVEVVPEEALGLLEHSRPGQKRIKVYNFSYADLIHRAETVNQVRDVVSRLLRDCPGPPATRRKLHKMADAKIAALSIRPAILGPDSGRLIATPAEARKERR